MSAMWLSGLRDDIRYAARGLLRAPALAVGVVITLGLGIGANLSLFSVLDAVLWRPPTGVEGSDQVRRVWRERTFAAGTKFWSGFSYPQYAAMQAALGQNAEVVPYLPPSPMQLGPAGRQEDVSVSLASASYFSMLGVRPAQGRFYSAEEDRLGAGERVAVISGRFAQRHFGAGTSAVGEQLLLDGDPYTVVGVAGGGFVGTELDVTDVWVPLGTLPGSAARPWWTGHGLSALQVLMRPTRPDLADAPFAETVRQALRTPEATVNPADSASIVQLSTINRAGGPGEKEHELVVATRLMGVTMVVLLIALINVSNLLVARAVRRRQEIAIRLALGISRGRLARMVVAESGLLAFTAAGVALIVSYWGTVVLQDIVLPDIQWAPAPLHARVAGLAVAGGILCGLVAGVPPAIQALRGGHASTLRTGGGGSHARTARWRVATVVAQTALSVLLLVTAGLFVRSVINVHGLRVGFDTTHLVLGGGLRFDAPDSARSARMPQAMTALAERMRRTAGVENVAMARLAPKREFGQLDYVPDVDTLQYPKPAAVYNAVSREFFSVTGMRLLEGHGFAQYEAAAMPPVVVVNEAMARAQWPGMSAIGRCMQFDADGPCFQVIGVVETALFKTVLEEPQPQFYVSLDHPPAKTGPRISWIIVRARPRALPHTETALRGALMDAFPDARHSLVTMETLLEPEYRPWRMGAKLFSSFALLALLVVSAGVFSIVSFTVAQRTHEFGVRAALGAGAGDIRRAVLIGSLQPVLVGVAVGGVLSVLGGRVISSMLYGVQPSDPLVLGSVALLLLLVATAAALGPARRAANVDPVTSLRHE